MLKNEDIDFLMYTVKQTEDTIVDVTVDLFVREYKVEYTNLYGQTLQPEKTGKLRRKAIREFSERLEELDIVGMPHKETNTLPTKLKSAMFMYIIKDETYFTEGHKDKELAALHKAIEYLIGTTFGSYEFYK